MLRSVLLVQAAASSATTLAQPQVHVIDSSCSATGDCSARLQAALDACGGERPGGTASRSRGRGPGGGSSSSPACEIRLAPPGAEFRLEQSSALNATNLRGEFALYGDGARLLLHGDAPFLVADCSSSSSSSSSSQGHRTAAGDPPGSAAASAGLTLSNLTLLATRPAFTYGVVTAAVPGEYFNLSVDMSLYPMNDDLLPWTRRVDTIHEVDPQSFVPSVQGLDWIYQGKPTEELQLQVDSTRSTVSFPDHAAARPGQPFKGFGLRVGAGVVLRHMLEFTKPKLDSIVVLSCSNVVVSDVTIHSSPGMGVLAHDCTNVTLERVRNTPQPQPQPRPNKVAPASRDSGGENGGGRSSHLAHASSERPLLPLAGNADAMHLASCRGEVIVRDCIADRQGDDGLNIHSQYAVVQKILPAAPYRTRQQHQHEHQRVPADSAAGHAAGHAAGVLRVAVGPNVNADSTTWGVVFARPVFRIGDTVAVRTTSNSNRNSPNEALGVILRATITHIEDGEEEDKGSGGPLVLTLTSINNADHDQATATENEKDKLKEAEADAADMGSAVVSVGDFVISLSAMPSRVLVSGNRFTNSRASGIILQ
jgi:hypothetical protein